MDDLEDIIKLDTILKSENASTSSELIDETTVVVNSNVASDLQFQRQIAANCITKSVTNERNVDEVEVCLQVDYSEQVERDIKEIEQQNILAQMQRITDGISVPKNITDSLTALEKDDLKIIEACTSPELKQLMLINRTKNLHLVHVLKQLIELLNTTNKVSWETQKRSMPAFTVYKSGTSGLGIPYFKLRNNKISCWSNPDVERKRHNNELMLCKMIPPLKWTLKDKLLLKKLVPVLYSCCLEREILEKVRGLEEKCKKAEDKKEIVGYKRQIREMNAKVEKIHTSGEEVYPELNSNADIDWYEISDQMKGRHSAFECKAYWNMFLHPERKEKKWTKSEDTKLAQLAKLYNYQSWERIAAELGVERSPFSVCSHYYSQLSKKNIRKEKFLPEEDELLLEIIETCKIGNLIPWSKVAYYFEGRTKTQLYHRYTYYLAGKNERKLAHFTFEEDALIMALVERLGKNFSAVAEYVPDRSSMQIKNRYNCYLQNPDLTYRPFSAEEDRQILEHGAAANKSNWGTLARKINLPRSHLRHRYNTLSKWIAKNPEKELVDVPRRYVCKADELNAKFDQLKRITDGLRNLQHMPTLEDVRKCMNKRKLIVKNPQTYVKHTVHNRLIEYFKTGYKISRACTFVTECSTEKDAMIVDDILQLLGADLALPHPSEIEDDQNLDKLDVFLLNHLVKKNQTNPHQSRIKWSIPPNLGTVVGLRNMIMTLSITRSKPALVNTLNTNASAPKKLPEAGRVETAIERRRFHQRLYSIFRWPSIMSLVEVSEMKIPCMLDVCKTVEQVKKKKKRGRPRKDVDKMNQKIRRMIEAKEKKRKEQKAEAALSSYISVRDFARLDPEVQAPSSGNRGRSCRRVNCGASTSGGPAVNAQVGKGESLQLNKSRNVRTYKRKRVEVKTELNDDEPAEKVVVLDGVKVE